MNPTINKNNVTVGNNGIRICTLGNDKCIALRFTAARVTGDQGCSVTIIAGKHNSANNLFRCVIYGEATNITFHTDNNSIYAYCSSAYYNCSFEVLTGDGLDILMIPNFVSTPYSTITIGKVYTQS